MIDAQHCLRPSFLLVSLKSNPQTWQTHQNVVGFLAILKFVPEKAGFSSVLNKKDKRPPQFGVPSTRRVGFPSCSRKKKKGNQNNKSTRTNGTQRVSASRRLWHSCWGTSRMPGVLSWPPVSGSQPRPFDPFSHGYASKPKSYPVNIPIFR